MTCIVGFKSNNDVYIGADSAGTNSRFEQRTRVDSKVFSNGEFLIGFTSSFRMGQLLRYSFSPPEYIEKLHGDIFEYMCTAFVDELRLTLINGGYAQSDKGEESGGTFLVGFKGRLFSIHDDYQVGEVADSYDACGCGENYALGTLFTLAKSEEPPETIVQLALESAEYFSAGVRSPFNIMCLKGEN